MRRLLRGTVAGLYGISLGAALLASCLCPMPFADGSEGHACCGPEASWRARAPSCCAAADATAGSLAVQAPSAALAAGLPLEGIPLELLPLFAPSSPLEPRLSRLPLVLRI